MARKVSIGINWQGPLDYKALFDKARIADEVGVHSVWVPEAWGRDAFTPLTLLADCTKNIQLGTAIVNIYSRTPAALAQHLATLNAKSVKLTAELADGWLPIMIPLPKLKGEIDAVRQMSVAAGRPADAVSVRAPGAVVVTKDVDRARAESASTLAFYIGRMGTFYAEQLTRHGYGEAVQPLMKAEEGGSGRAARAA